MSHNTPQKPIDLILSILSAVAFAGSAAFGIIVLYSSAFQEQKNSAPTARASKDAQLKVQARGYELVLQREPNNQLAVEGLSRLGYR